MPKKNTSNIEQLKVQARMEVAQEALSAKSLLSQEAEASLMVIKRAAAEQLQIINNHTANALKVQNSSVNNDHDTVISFGVKIDNIDIKFTEKFAEIKADIKEIKDGTARRIDTLENTKLDTKDSYPVLYKENVDARLDNHSKRINEVAEEVAKIDKSVEGNRRWMVGLFGSAALIATLIVYIYFSDIGRLRNDLEKHEVETQKAFQNIIK